MSTGTGTGDVTSIGRDLRLVEGYMKRHSVSFFMQRTLVYSRWDNL
jgi:hypothetical protein